VVCRITHTEEIPLLSEKIRANMHAHSFTIGEGISLHKTCSIGAVPYPFYENELDKLSWEQTITIANVALHSAKSNYRNAWVYLYPNQKNISCQELTTKVSSYITDGLLKYQTSIDLTDFLKSQHVWQTFSSERPSALIESLTKRELEVLILISKGYSNSDICEDLSLALDTIKGCNRRIYSKLGVNKRIEAVLIAQQLGLI
jgi:DNA-binding CsgD family transcriptional regulator